MRAKRNFSFAAENRAPQKGPDMFVKYQKCPGESFTGKISISRELDGRYLGQSRPVERTRSRQQKRTIDCCLSLRFLWPRVKWGSITGRLIIHDPPAHTRPRFPTFKGNISRCLPSSRLVPRSSWRRHDMCHEEVSDGVIGVQAGSDTTWSATQVGLRTVKAGLGGQDDGVSGVDGVLEKHRSRYENGSEWHCRNMPPSVISTSFTKNSLFRTKTFNEHHPETTLFKIPLLFFKCSA